MVLPDPRGHLAIAMGDFVAECAIGLPNRNDCVLFQFLMLTMAARFGMLFTLYALVLHVKHVKTPGPTEHVSIYDHTNQYIFTRECSPNTVTENPKS